MQDTEFWRKITLEAMQEFAETTFGSECVTTSDATTPEHVAGAFVSLFKGEPAIRIGLLTSKPGCQALSKALFAMEPEDDDMSDEEIADAVGEIVNILAGAVRMRMNPNHTGELGLPMFCDDVTQPINDQTLYSVRIEVPGLCDASLMIQGPENSQEIL